jgi:NADH-quinone oxidoreductase subunit H
MAFKYHLLFVLCEIILLILFLLLSVAYLTLLERKVLGAVQIRQGPVQVGFLGILQPLSDGLKLILKEFILPKRAKKSYFLFSPFFFLLFAVLQWLIICFDYKIVFFDFEWSLLFTFTISGLSVYGVIFSGWSSNSRYAFLGALRSSAQMISYEISIGFILLVFFSFFKTLNYSDIVLLQQDCWFFLPFLPLFIILFICLLAETNRTPFDLPEAEAELVAGYNIEYSSIGFAFFFIAEYMNIIFSSVILVLLFFGGWLVPFGLSGSFFLILKTLLIVFLFLFIRASLPRFRYDQLMLLGWKWLLPLSVGFFFFYFLLKIVWL